MLLRLAYLGLTNTVVLLRLLPMSDRDKDIEILALRHQIGVPNETGRQDRVTPRDPAVITLNENLRRADLPQ